jgi:hypothetical protein
MSITSPLDIPGLLVWYSAEAETGYADGDPMTGWTDLSGNGNHATAQGTLKPLWQANTGPGLAVPAVRFRGAHGSTSATWGYFALPASVIASSAGEVMTMIKSDFANCSLWGLGATAGTAAASHYPFSSNIYEAFGTTTRREVLHSLSSPQVITAWRRYNVWSAANDYAIRLDAVSQFASASNTVLWDAAPVIGHGKRSGALSTNTGSFQGHMSAFVLYGRKLTTTERADLDAWMVANPGGGTLQPEAPTDLAVTAAAQTSVSVSWAAPVGGPAPTGYDVRVDGGPPAAVGNVLAHTFTSLTPGTAYTLEVRATTAAGSSAWVGVTATTSDPQPSAPGIASQAVLAAAGLDPSPDGVDAPAQQWWDMDPDDAETYSPARSIGLYGYSINYASRDPLSRPQPITLTVQVMVPIGEHIGIGDRFRLRLCAPLAAVLGLGDDTGAIRATAIVTDSQADPMVMYDLPPHGPAIMYTIAATGWAPRYASARVDGTGWPTEAAGVRIGRILDGIGLAGTVPADGPDVLPPAAPGTYLEALGAVTDSINGRVVEQPHGLLDYLPADSRRGTLPAYSLDASEIIGTPFSWRESVGDIINTADVRYGSGTGESVTVTNPASADPRRGVGTYATARTTVLAEEADASAYGTGLVGRRAWPFPQLPAVAVDLARSGLELARIAALFATRVGTRVAFTSMPAGSPWEDLPRGCFTEGYTETATAFAWRISLVVSDPAVSGVGLRYIDVPAGVSYLDVRNGLSYLDVARIEDPADLI